MTVTERTLYPDPLSDLHWAAWLACIVPAYCEHPFAAHHKLFWEWVWGIGPESAPDPFVGIWARGGAKSTSVEASIAALGARDRRRYCLYVCDTQDRADDHVGNIGAMFEGERMEDFYPQHADRDVGKFGNAKGWRRNRLRTAGGFVVDAIGLDTAARGVKVDDQRPDMIVLDDIDGRHDTTRTTTRKLETITEGVLPAGAPGRTAVAAIQNLIHPNGVFARMVDGRADMLANRIMSGPIPALRNMTVADDGTVDGEPTWQGQSVDVCNAMVSLMGLRAFRREAQHDVAEVEGALWEKQWIDDGRVPADFDTSQLRRIVVAIDPNVSSSEGADEAGIVAAGITADNWCPTCGQVSQPHFYVLADESGVFGPAVWAKRGVALFHRLDADKIVGEVNNGGELVSTQVRQEDRDVPFAEVRASRGKTIRAEPVASLYDPSEGGECRVHHVGVLDRLETQFTTWVHGDPHSPGALDAAVWALTSLMRKPVSAGSAFVPSGPLIGPNRGARW